MSIDSSLATHCVACEYSASRFDRTADETARRSANSNVEHCYREIAAEIRTGRFHYDNADSVDAWLGGS